MDGTQIRGGVGGIDGAEGLLTHNLHQFFEHNGCFVVDNIAIDQARIAQVIKWLANRCRAESKILGKR